jgi:hypothetical protein
MAMEGLLLPSLPSKMMIYLWMRARLRVEAINLLCSWCGVEQERGFPPVQMPRGSGTSVLVLIAVLPLELTCSNPQVASRRACLGRGMLPSWTWNVVAPGEDGENSGGVHESRRRPHQNPNHQPCHAMLRLRGGKGSWRGKQSGARVGLDGVAHLVNHLRERGEIPAAPNRGSGPGGEETQQGAAPYQLQKGTGGGRDAEGDVIGEENEEDEAMLRQVLEPAKAPATSPAPARSAEAEPFMGNMHPSRMINTAGAAASAPRPETMNAGQVHPSRAHNVGVGLPDGHPPPLNSPYHQQPDPSPRGGDWSSRRMASRRGKEFANREKARQFFEVSTRPRWRKSRTPLHRDDSTIRIRKRKRGNLLLSPRAVFQRIHASPACPRL